MIIGSVFRRSHITPLLTVQAVATLFAACADPSGPQIIQLDIPFRTVTLSVPGKPVSLGVIPRRGSHALPPEAASYRSLDTGVVRLDEYGVARAFGDGRAAVVVSSGGLTDTVWVNVQFDRPVWRFSLTAAISSVTIAGTSDRALRRDFQRQIDSVNALFNEPAVFEGYVHFVPMDHYVFTRLPSQELEIPPAKTDFKIVFHTDTAIKHADFRPNVRVAQIGALPGRAFMEDKTWIVAHELAHARGATDLYFSELVGSRDNPVNGQSFFFPPSIMNGNDVRVWDDLTRYIVSRNADVRDVFDHSYQTGVWLAMVPSLGVRVLDHDGRPVANAVVSYHWAGRSCSLPWLFCGVQLEPGYVGSTDQEGRAAQPPARGPSGSELAFPILQLVTVRAASVETWTWLPLTEVARWAIDHPGQPYWQTVRMP